MDVKDPIWELRDLASRQERVEKKCDVFEEEIKQIEENISKFQKFYERLKSLDLDMLKKMDQKEIDLKFSYLKDVDKKFMNIKNIVDVYLNE